MNLYVAAAIAVVSVGGVLYVSHLQDKVKTLEEQVSLQATQIEIAQDNVLLLSDQLAFERENNNKGSEAISELREDVPNVDFNTPLPPSVQGVLDRFHYSIRN